MRNVFPSRACVLALVFSILLAVVPATAMAQHQLPAFYYGTVTVVGPERSISALPGSLVTTRVGGWETTYDPVVVGMAGRYGGPTGPEDKLLVQDARGYTLVRGDVIEFYINGVRANETSTFESSSIKQHDLTVNDGDGPTAPSDLHRSTADNVNQPSFAWGEASDTLCGVASYGVRLDSGPWQWLGAVLTWTAAERLSDGQHIIEVSARDGVGNAGAAASLAFTIDTSLPAAFNIRADTVQETSAIIAWSSNKPALSWLDYGPSAGNYPWTLPAATTPSTSHAVTITGLLPGVAYHYRVTVKDSLGNVASSGDLSFTTLAPPGPGSTPLTTIIVTPTPTPGATETPAPVVQRVIDEGGMMLVTMVLASADGVARVEITEGTRALDSAGKPLAQVVVRPLSQPPQFLGGVPLVSYDFQPEGATFSPPVKVTMGYDTAAIPPGYTEEHLRIAYYDSAKGEWTSLPSMVDAVGRTVSTLVGHFTPFALVVEEQAATPTLSPSERPSFIDRLIEKAIIAAAALLAFIAALVALVVILRGRRRG